MNPEDKESCLIQLYEIGAIQFGEFLLKSGIVSPIYIDLRLIVSYPPLLQQIATLMGEMIKECHFERVCGVPYTALPIATAISLAYNIPMVMRRKEAKAHGTKKIIEGAFKKGQSCLIVEDLITSGLSIFETISPLEQEGLVVKDVVVLLDRQQGGKQKLEAHGIELHAVFTITDLLSQLLDQSILTQTTYDHVKQFLKENQC